MRSNPTPEEYRKQIVTWACGTLRARGIAFEARPGGWDVETSEGWKVATTPEELAAIARNARPARDISPGVYSGE